MSSTEKELENIDYSYYFIFKPKLLISGLILFMVTIFYVFPINKKIDALIYSSISNIPGCPISLGSYEFKVFPPRIVFNNIKVEGICYGQPGKSLALVETFIFIRGISLSPFGVSFKVNTTVLDTPLEIFVIPGFSSISLLLENESKNGKFLYNHNKINFDKLKKYIPFVKLKGEIVLSTVHIELGYNGKLKDLNLNLASNNFVFPKQSIMYLTIDALKINSLLIQATKIKGNKIVLKKLILGDERSPIKIDFSGGVTLNMKNIKKSSLDLTGEVFINDKILKKYPLDSLFLGRFDKKDKYYQIQIKGSIGKPQFKKAR